MEELTPLTFAINLGLIDSVQLLVSHPEIDVNLKVIIFIFFNTILNIKLS